MLVSDRLMMMREMLGLGIKDWRLKQRDDRIVGYLRNDGGISIIRTRYQASNIDVVSSFSASSSRGSYLR